MLAAGIRPRCRADGVYLLRDHLCLGELRFESEQRHKVSVQRIPFRWTSPLFLTDFYDVDYLRRSSSRPTRLRTPGNRSGNAVFWCRWISHNRYGFGNHQLALYDQPVPARGRAEALFTFGRPA
ncbi:MAG: hypothetical protein ACLSAP_05800 [Oscillospiraceae bacterium]